MFTGDATGVPGAARVQALTPKLIDVVYFVLSTVLVRRSSALEVAGYAAGFPIPEPHGVWPGAPAYLRRVLRMGCAAPTPLIGFSECPLGFQRQGIAVSGSFWSFALFRHGTLKEKNVVTCSCPLQGP